MKPTKPFSKNNLDRPKIITKKVLGLEWDTKNDEIVFKFEPFICLANSLTPSKRNELKVPQMSPITARIKTIFQLLCKSLCSSDENISSEIESNCNDFSADLKQFEMLRVKRFVFVQPRDIISSISLHGFCDSSSQVYCGLVYI